MPTYTGSCHCGEVRFQVEAECAFNKLIDCNCSICVKKGILHVPVAEADFRLLDGEQHLSVYKFRSNMARHWFCRTCGIHTFGRPRNDPSRYTVNARCLDQFESILATAAIHPFDGQNHPKDS